MGFEHHSISSHPLRITTTRVRVLSPMDPAISDRYGESSLFATDHRSSKPVIYGILHPASATLGFSPLVAETRDRTPTRTPIVTAFPYLSPAAASRRRSRSDENEDGDRPRCSLIPFYGGGVKVGFVSALRDPSDLRSKRSATTSRLLFHHHRPLLRGDRRRSRSDEICWIQHGGARESPPAGGWDPRSSTVAESLGFLVVSVL
ncbi:hypothetical protein Drorol1_Dr00021394 [Drosera rotundifolia]